MHHHALRARFVALHAALAHIADDVQDAIAQLDATSHSDAATQTVPFDTTLDASATSQEEDEVWRVLVTSTPLSNPDPASSGAHFHSPISVDPLVLHDLSPPFSERSLSPLTSIGNTSEVDLPGTVRAAIGGAGSMPVGGPDAPPDELGMLARRAPLKIRLKISETKRKRDAVDGACKEDQGHAEMRSEHKPGNAQLSSGLGGTGEHIPAPDAGSLGVRAPPKQRKRHRKGGKSANVPSSHISMPTLCAPSTSTVPKCFTDSPNVPKLRGQRRTHVRRGESSPVPESVSAQPLKSVRIPRHCKGREKETSAPSSSHTEDTVRVGCGWGVGTWPELRGKFGQWDVSCILCDSCEMWYHYGCVAIAPGDPRLESGVTFICPACQIGMPGQHIEDRKERCGRPDCPKIDWVEDSEHFFVEKLVGRQRIERGVYMWLAKWEGYPISQATWIPKDNLGEDGGKLFDAFNEDAIAEGADMSQDIVLLWEAFLAGWEA